MNHKTIRQMIEELKDTGVSGELDESFITRAELAEVLEVVEANLLERLGEKGE